MNLQASATSRDAEDLLFFRMPRFVLEIQNCCSCLDLICDRGVRTKRSRKFVPGKRHPPILCQVIGAVVAQLFWLCMKVVLSLIAKDIVAKGLDHDTFVLSLREIKPKKLDTEPVQGQLREVIRRVAADGILYGCRRKTTSCHLTLEYWQRDKFWDLVSRFLILCLEMLETSALGLGQDPGLLLVLEGAMTNSTYVSRFSFIQIPYRFKVRDSQNCCSYLDLICDRGVRTKGSRKFVPGKRHPPIPCFVWCWPSEISFVLCSALFVRKLPPLFPREIKPKKLDTKPVRSQLRGDFLLGRDQAE
ncbi:hypothetical protein F2Q69_00030289 [Brassica cretica]|uniref:Uncharacterized protein n=1 Tax=Brassica cretica TaxID=69181 RepID=A0A8S9S4A4_BRACR|nr:hypothetical protein F2Q69_00030289 [Brassica cretica]